MANAEPEERQCPDCGDPVTNVAVVGPDEAIVSPCGHSVNPESIE